MRRDNDWKWAAATLALMVAGCLAPEADEWQGPLVAGCPVAIAPTSEQMPAALEAIDEWNDGRLDWCGATVHPLGAPLGDAEDANDVRGIIADLACEVAPC